MTAATYKVPAEYQLGKSEGFFYGRFGSITRNSLEETVAKLENSKEAMVFGTGE